VGCWRDRKFERELRVADRVPPVVSRRLIASGPQASVSSDLNFRALASGEITLS
jgi:hypothetical protein